jgi:hypothetical protein
MLAQHLVTKPVFEALFSGHSLRDQEPDLGGDAGHPRVAPGAPPREGSRHARALLRVGEAARGGHRERRRASRRSSSSCTTSSSATRSPRCPSAWASCTRRWRSSTSSSTAWSTSSRTEFGQTLGSKGVHILDPFTGTGTFITRLIQSGLIDAKDLPHKYKHEIHANEMVLLAYYIAAINIEAAYHGVVGGEYQPFEGICLTDTFQLYEKEDLISPCSRQQRAPEAAEEARYSGDHRQSAVLRGAEERERQQSEHRVPRLSTRGSQKPTRAAPRRSEERRYTTATSARSAGPATEWDRAGVVGFVTNAGFIEATTADGLRKCLADEFSSLYVFHLRGNQRTAGRVVQARRRQGLRQRLTRSRRHLAAREEPECHRLGPHFLPRCGRLPDARAEARDGPGAQEHCRAWLVELVDRSAPGRPRRLAQAARRELRVLHRDG